MGLKEDYLKELNYLNNLKSTNLLNNNHHKGRLEAMEDYASLILCEVGCSEPKEMPQVLELNGKKYIHKSYLLSLIDKGDYIEV